MKNLFSAIVLIAIAVLALLLSSCELIGTTTPEISVSEDGYLVVDGNKTEYKSGKEDTVTVDSDDYIVVNGNKTEYNENICSHSYIRWQIYNNGITTYCEEKLYFSNCLMCDVTAWKQGTYDDHDWNTVTTEPTCEAGGFDTKTCTLCGKIEICNQTSVSAHIYSDEYSNDNTYHWKKCNNCDNAIEKEEHTANDNGSCSVCLAPFSATAGLIYDVSSDGTYAEVIGYEGEPTRIRIAEEYNGLPVKEIHSGAFSHNEKITEVIIPDSVTSIGASAFFCCHALQSVVIENAVTSVGRQAFYNCSALKNVVIGNGVTKIGQSAFSQCFSLSSITIPDSVTEIGEFAFNECFALQSVVIGNGVTEIGKTVFRNCSSISSIVIPDSVTKIKGYSLEYSQPFINVYYTGSEEDWGKISISQDENYDLFRAIIHYNYSEE